jgi:acetate---CoA ligase (ADP-forming) subunit beta
VIEMGGNNDTTDIGKMLQHWHDSGRRVVHEADTKTLLGIAGITVPRRAEGNGPFAVKLSSDRFPHKTDHGLVKLNVAKLDVETLGRHMLDADPEGQLLVEDMVEGSVGEWIIGCKHDASFGPVVLAGPGGVFVELLDQVEVRLAPTTFNVASAMIREGQGTRLLAGLRGKPAGDADALADLVVAVSRLFSDHRDLIEEI